MDLLRSNLHLNDGIGHICQINIKIPFFGGRGLPGVGQSKIRLCLCGMTFNVYSHSNSTKSLKFDISIITFRMGSIKKCFSKSRMHPPPKKGFLYLFGIYGLFHQKCRRTSALKSREVNNIFS